MSWPYVLRGVETPARAQDAVGVFEVLLADRGPDSVHAWTLRRVLGVVGLRRRAVPPGMEAGRGRGLYQYGVYSFRGPPRFELSLVRQFSVNGGHESLQFHRDQLFAPTQELVGLGTYDDWRFTDTDVPLQDWCAALARHPEWHVLRGAWPMDMTIHVEET